MEDLLERVKNALMVLELSDRIRINQEEKQLWNEIYSRMRWMALITIEASVPENEIKE